MQYGAKSGKTRTLVYQARYHGSRMTSKCLHITDSHFLLRNCSHLHWSPSYTVSCSLYCTKPNNCTMLQSQPGRYVHKFSPDLRSGNIVYVPATETYYRWTALTSSRAYSLEHSITSHLGPFQSTTIQATAVNWTL